VQAQNTDTPPKIGLVLSGGGARGFAHIGVIKVLEEEGIDVDFIGGTSMGSIVGGLYAMGYSIFEIEKMALTQDWDYVLNDRISRRELGFYEKYNQEKYVLSLALSGRKISIPPGLVYGQNVTQLLTQLTDPSFQSVDFNDLEIPFLCMATDLLSGNAVKLDTGNLAMAIRASMSVPSAFAPVKYGPYYLVDGGVIDNFPAEHVKNLGADYLIGVDIQTPLYEQSEINNLVQVLSQSIFLNSESVFNKNMELIDFLIKPEIDPFTALDFNRADSLIKRGEEKARELIPKLRMFLDSIGHQPEIVRGKTNAFPDMDVLYVHRVVYYGNKKISDKFLSRQLDIRSGDQISMTILNEKISQLYGTRLFHTVYYELEYSKSGETVIKIFVDEAAMFDVNVGAHYNDYTKAGLLLNLTSRNLGIRNGRLSIDLALGKVARFSSEYVVDNGLSPSFGANLNLFKQYGYTYDQEKKVISYDIGIARFQGFGLMTFKNFMRLKMGFELEENNVSQDVSIIDFEDLANFSGNLFADFTYDTYDRIYFPTKGLYFNGKFEWGGGESTDLEIDENGSLLYKHYDYSFYAIFAKLEGVVNISDKVSLIPSFYFRQLIGENVVFSKLSSFGGFQKTYIESYLPFPGYDFMQIEGHTAIFPSFDLRYSFWNHHYFCLKTNFLSIDLDLDKGIDKNDFYFGAVLSYSYSSPFGPISLSMAKAYPLNKYVFDLSLGFWF
jgi:NTE family protein